MKFNKAVKNIIVPEELTPKVESYVMEYINRPVRSWTLQRLSFALFTGFLLLWLMTGDHNGNSATMAEENELKIISVMVVEAHTAIWLEPLAGQNGG